MFPILRGVIHHPYFTKQGILVIEAGYNQESGLWYQPPIGIALPAIPNVPTKEELEASVHFLLSELLADFPFTSEADRSNALAFVFQPFLRLMIQGPTPFCLIEAPTPGTGKGLLACSIAFAAIGKALEATPQRNGDEEWRKVITAAVIGTPDYIFFDNLTGNLRSPALAAALTTEYWSDRFLGESRMVRVPIRCGWLATGNNVDLNPDILRRTVHVRLDAKMQSPEERDVTKFKHPRLLAWAQESRGELIRAILVVINAWIAAGRPPGTEMLGSYESWAEILGGVLKQAGRPGFLGNRGIIKFTTSEDDSEFGQFITAWLGEFELAPTAIDELFDICVKYPDILPYVMAAETELGRRQRLGKFLKKNRNRVWEGHQLRLCDAVEKRSRCRLYELIDLSKETAEVAPSNPSPITQASSSAPTQAGCDAHCTNPAATRFDHLLL